MQPDSRGSAVAAQPSSQPHVEPRQQPHACHTTREAAPSVVQGYHLTPVATHGSFRPPGTQTAPSTPLSHTLTRQASNHSTDMSPPSTPAQVTLAVPPNATAEAQMTPRTRRAAMAGVFATVRERLSRSRRGRGAAGGGPRQRSLSEDAGVRQHQEVAAEQALRELEKRWHGDGAASACHPGSCGSSCGGPRTEPRLNCGSACGKTGCCWCGGALGRHGTPAEVKSVAAAAPGTAGSSAGVQLRVALRGFGELCGALRNVGGPTLMYAMTPTAVCSSGRHPDPFCAFIRALCVCGSGLY